MTHSPVIVSYKSVKAKFVGVSPSHLAMVEMNCAFVLDEATAAQKSSQSSARHVLAIHLDPEQKS